MNIFDWIKAARALGAGGLLGAIGRVATASEAVDGTLKATPELAELRSSLDELRRALRSR